MRQKKLTVLLIEKNKEETLLLQKMIEKTPHSGCQLHHVERLNEATKFLSTRSADLILLDLDLPDSRGISALTALQNAYPKIPIIVLIQKANDEMLAERAVDAGADDYLVKNGLHSEKLIQTIESVIERKQLLNQLAAVEDDLADAHALFKQILISLPDGVVILDEKKRVRFANPSSSFFLGYEPEELIGNPFEFSIQAEEKIERQIGWGAKQTIFEMYAVEILWEGQGGTLVFLKDITEQKKMAERLVYLTHRDALTGLPNRVLLTDFLQKMITTASQADRGFAVLLIEIDGLRRINDTLGYPSGNILLQEFGKRLTAFMRGSDRIARVGGDEFVIVLPNITGLEAMTSIIEKMTDPLCMPYDLEGDECMIALSIGISLYPKDTRDPEILLEYAEMASDHAKKNGTKKNRVHFYSPALQEQTQARLNLENDLRSAIVQHNLFPMYQPIVSLKTGKIVGMEVLLRLKHPQMGILHPGQFISIAEETGLIVEIGTWVLMTACAQSQEWQEMGIAPLTMAVNLSAIQLKEANFVTVVKRILHRTGLPPRYLELELTESMMQDAERTLRVLSALREIGVIASIDDFGTGYSSLSHLRQFPFHTLKIDISFVRNMMHHEKDRSLVKTIIMMAHNFQLQTIAEGVETLEQLQALQELGCDNAQGFFLSKPLSTEDATVRLFEKRLYF